MPNRKRLLKIGETVYLCTNTLEQYLDARYEARARQRELEALEMEYSKRVSEDELNITDEELDMGEEIHSGASLEEQLCRMYHRYLMPDERCGMEIEDIIGNMRSALELYAHGKINTSSDAEIFAAAKDIYEHKKDLIAKYQSLKKFSN